MQKIMNFLTHSAGTHSKLGDLGLLILRLSFGLSMAFSHGLHKVPPSEGFVNVVAKMGFIAPEFFAWMAGLSELVGGIMIAVGFLGRGASLFLLQTMLVALLIKHGGDPFRKMESAFLFSSFCITLLCTGMGRWSLDHYIWKSNRSS